MDATLSWRLLTKFCVHLRAFSHPLTECDPCVRCRTVQFHNSLVISLFNITSHTKPQPSAPLPPPKPTPRKRRRTLSYQPLDGSDQNTLRSARLKKWTLSIGRRERERVKTYEDGTSSIPRPLRGFQDEISQEQGVMLVPEKTGET